jgi:hypothetical protein
MAMSGANGKKPVITPSWTAAEVRAALRVRYPRDDRISAPRYGLIEEVRNGTGFDATRSCDALAFHFWPSDGLSLHGFEIKVSRADWLRELQQPRKSEAWAQYCDFWWIAVGRADIVAIDELPPGWGLMVPNARSMLHVARAARKFDPQPLPRSVLVAIVRNCLQATSEATRHEIISKLRPEIEARSSHQLERAQKDLQALTERIEAFERASGLQLNGYDSPVKLGEVVRAVRGVLADGYNGALQTVEGHANALRVLLRQCESASSEIRRLREVPREVQS